MVDTRTKRTRQISDSTWRPAGWGYYRIMALSNGDYLLTCGPGRRETVMQIVKGDFSEKPLDIGRAHQRRSCHLPS